MDVFMKTATREARQSNIWKYALNSLMIALLGIGPLLNPAQGQQIKNSAGDLSERQRITHVLNRLGFGPRPGDVERVRRLGVEKYIEQQLNPERITDSAAAEKVKNLPTLTMSTAELYAQYPQPGQLMRRLQRDGTLPANRAAPREQEMMPAPGNSAIKEDDAQAPAQERRAALREYYAANNLSLPQRITVELQASRILRAVYSERQLQEVMVDFWTNHFNVYANKGADRWLLIGYDRDTIRPHAMNRFVDLLRATAQSPAMLFYLDNFQSVSPQMQNRRQNRRRRLPSDQELTPAPARKPKRGINENYARELMELHTLGVDGGYTQKDVQEVARCFTGWTIKNPRGARNGNAADDADAGTFFFNARAHDDGEKIVLGQRIPAGGGINDGLTVLEILARHPSTAKLIATKLSRRFVSDDPPAALVSRVAAAYTKSNGDIRVTLRAIFTAPEFNAPAAYRAKIKTPFELGASALRALDADTDGDAPIHKWIAKMGEPLYMYQAPTGYPDTAESWVNTGALLERLNFALALSANRVKGTRVDLERFATNDAPARRDQAQLVNHFVERILQNEVSPQTRATLLKQLSEPQATQDVDGRKAANISELAKIAGLVLGTPEFQRQ